MLSPLRLGQALRGRLGTYTVSKQIQDSVWFAKNQTGNTVVVKSVSGHPRVENEKDVLRLFQRQCPYIRPMIDEIEELANPTTIVLKHLDNHLLEASSQKTLNRKEIKYVSRRILEALSVLHEDNYVHTDVKLNNVFVNCQDDHGDNRFSSVQPGDFGGTYSQKSHWAKTGTVVGSPMWTSPEVLMETPWNTATDIWSFGAVLISLIYGGDFNLFRPKEARYDDENYNVEVVKSQFRYFGPFPAKVEEIFNEETLTSVIYLMQLIPPSQMTPFNTITDQEVNKGDKEFIGKIMKMDWRDRPTAKELLQDKWFLEEGIFPSQYLPIRFGNECAPES